ncbi:MAG: hypothetical protein COX07_06610 [Bacteroidetes bacterium CG23_combo_of_CG06-09_8_20_14_all_32_9]|nr:MAG: hypothetical protein COX07_06610 [Bacteroidetes bacterium CG23_combo_of_CG06-09_8_20_14_all_32_9]
MFVIIRVLNINLAKQYFTACSELSQAILFTPLDIVFFAISRYSMRLSTGASTFKIKYKYE